MENARRQYGESGNAAAEGDGDAGRIYESAEKYSGSNTEFCERYNEYAGQTVSARGLKRLMNLWEYRLADFGVRFRSHRSNGARLLEIEYSFSAGDESAVGDG